MICEARAFAHTLTLSLVTLVREREAEKPLCQKPFGKDQRIIILRIVEFMKIDVIASG